MQNDPPQKYTVFVIPHTHWDREWYATFQQFRVRLVHVMDALLDLLERDPAYTHFNLDAQTVVLQDYLEIRPEKRAILQKFVRERRLGVGPWYVLPDEFLVSGEALVRNLLLGHPSGRRVWPRPEGWLSSPTRSGTFLSCHRSCRGSASRLRCTSAAWTKAI